MASESAKVIPAQGESPDPPPFPYNNKAGLAVANRDKPLAKLNGDATTILDRLQAGERALDVAASLGISHVALYTWMLRHCPDEWFAISAGKSLTRIEQAQADLDDAQDQLTVSRARESAKLAQWDLERVAKKLYGENKDQSGITINVVLDRTCGGEIDITPEK